MRFSDLLRDLTVDCKDDGQQFLERNRIQVIKSLLKDSSYKLIEEGNLSLMYARSGSKPESFRVLLSSHIDCVYSRCFSEEIDDTHWQGTFDNSATNAAVIDLMLRDELAPSVVISFTGDEERKSGGAKEVMRYLVAASCEIEHAIVLDVTYEGWEDEAVLTIENDRNFDILSGYRIMEILQESGYPCNFLHRAEPDETWEYGKGIEGLLPGLPSLSLCLPVDGEMHGEDGVCLRKASIRPFQDILTRLANACLMTLD